MSAGRYRTPVFLLEPRRLETVGGQAELQFEPAGEDFAEITMQNLVERFFAGRYEGMATHKIRMRYREDIQGGWLITSGTRRFRVLAALPSDQRRQEIICLVQEEGL